MQRGRAGRGDGIVDALDPVSGGKVRADRRGHAFRHREGADALGGAACQNRLMGREHGRGRWPARARDQPRTLIDDLVFGQARLRDGLAHRDMGIGRPRPHEAQRALVDMFGRVDLEGARNLATKAVFDHVGVGLDPRATNAQGRLHFGGGVSDWRDDAQPCNDDAAHAASLAMVGNCLGQGGGAAQGTTPESEPYLSFR